MDKIDRLVQKYVESVIVHGQESWGGNHVKANKHYRVYTKCFIEICKHGEEGKNVLKKLLEHSSHFVKCSAAYHILPFETATAIRILNKCKSAPDGVGLSAKTTLDEWNSGNLKFPIERDGKIVYVTPNELVAQYTRY